MSDYMCPKCGKQLRRYHDESANNHLCVPTTPDPSADDDCDPDQDCSWCCGEGYLDGEEMGDPLWYTPGELWPCPSCHGSGLAKDMTIW